VRTKQSSAFRSRWEFALAEQKAPPRTCSKGEIESMHSQNRSPDPLRLLKQIRLDLSKVNDICRYWDDGSSPEDEERVGGILERAFEGSLVLMESIGQPEARKRVLTLLRRARKNFTAAEYSVNAGEPYSVWSYQLSNMLNAVEILYAPLPERVEGPIEVISKLVRRLGAVEAALGQRYDSRKTLVVADEYDLQDLLRSLLFLHFKDISHEDPAAKVAGASSRVDILLRSERIAIEIKKTRSGSTDASLGRELKLDIGDYRERPDCKALVIVIDDRQKHLKNPQGLANDLHKIGREFPVHVFFVRS
jgi:hypothetical protein